MPELNQKQLVGNALAALALLLTASGILVNTMPLESKRPSDADHATIPHAGRQDVEARLWQSPFTVTRRVAGKTPPARCKEAKRDHAHHPRTLSKRIEHSVHDRQVPVTVLPVMVPGGPYFEDGETRRRVRYAVVAALLNSGWVPSDEDKLGYIWTFESCIDDPWLRWAPEILPWEWYTQESSGEESKESSTGGLLVVWVDDDLTSRHPLRSVQAIVKGLEEGGVPCPSSGAMTTGMQEGPKPRTRARALVQLAKKLDGAGSAGDGQTLCTKDSDLKLSGAGKVCDRFPDAASRPWCATRVLGPWTSDGLQGLAKDVARLPAGDDDHHWLRFYSSAATAPADEAFLKEVVRAVVERDRGQSTLAAGQPEPTTSDVAHRLTERLVRLTTTDDKLTRALLDELELRLVDPHPFWRLARRGHGRERALCGATVVIVAETDSSYARRFADQFATRLADGRVRDGCGSQRPNAVSKSYLRGLDGVLPEGTGEPVPSAQRPGGPEQVPAAMLLRQAPRERADGRSQYDYLRRLSEDLRAIEVRERREGRSGVRAIGVLGNDAYDRILVLEALRDGFPGAIFFTADLDARMLGADVTRWTRNLVVASAYGLSLNPGIQRSALPFRDTYQTGVYLSTLVALDERTRGLDTSHFNGWFADAQVFEIGRTQAVPLSRGADTECTGRGADPRECENVHRVDEWGGGFPWPQPATGLVFVMASVAALSLSLLLCERPRRAMRAIARTGWPGLTVFGLLVLALVLFCYRIWAGDVKPHAGEPFAWLEGVSLWPTVLLQLAASGVTVGLLWWYGLRKLSHDIGRLRERFGPAGSPLIARGYPDGGWIPRVRWLWWLDQGSAGERPSGPDPWLEFVDRMGRRERMARIAVMTILAFVVSMALISIDWPSSPHRGAFSAWANHGTLLLTLLSLMAVLFAVLDASSMATRFMDRLEPVVRVLEIREAGREDFWKRNPSDEEVRCLCTWFRLVVGLGSAVNRLIYLPVIALLLVIPARSRVFDAWTFPLAFWVVVPVSALLAVSCAVRLRRAAARFRRTVTAALDDQIADYLLEADLTHPGTAERAVAPAEPRAWSAMPPEAKARHIVKFKEEILSERGGPFRPLPEDPVVRAALLLLGGTGAISTAQFILDLPRFRGG